MERIVERPRALDVHKESMVACVPVWEGIASSASSPTRTSTTSPRSRRFTQHAQVEDRVKTLKATGANYLPFHSFDANAAWLELALAAHDVMVFTQLLTLDGEHQLCEPKRLRHRILHVAGQLTRHARQVTLHLPADWPWADAILSAFKRLQALPAPG